MAYFTPPTDAVAQPDETAGRDDTGNLKKSFSWKGPYADLEAAGKAIEKGDVVAVGWVASSWSVRRTPGNYGVLTIECTPPNPESEDPETHEPTVEPLKDIWSIKSVRNDVSIMAYCGISHGANPQRAHIEAWMKEPDGALAEQLKFRKPDGTVFDISQEGNQATVALINKIRKGVEAVIRFYPVVTRTRTYADCPPACLEKVGFINTPPAPAGTAKRPTGIGTAVAAHQWLKVQDDAQEQTDGNWTRTESWMGIAKSDNPDETPWDADLYGDDRWPMPYQR